VPRDAGGSTGGETVACFGLGVMPSQVVDSADRGIAPEGRMAAVMIVEMQKELEGPSCAQPLRSRASRKPTLRAWFR